MRRTLTLLFLLTTLFAKAQLYDAQWALGYDESVLDFRVVDTVSIYSFPSPEYFFVTNACISDESGNLLYYTNGVSICYYQIIIANGDSLSNGSYSESDSLDGLQIPQGAIFIPKPGSTRYYYLFHCANDANGQTRPGTIYYSVIDKEGDGGLGSVIQKNVPLITGQIFREGGITACKHANGRDYWLVFGQSGTNGYYKFLITPDSILGPYMQNIGPVYPFPYDIAYSKFSQDGTKYATGAMAGLILIMNFDRCTGEFGNPITIYNNVALNPDTSLSGCGSVEFSPNNRFVYAADENTLAQYDLQSDNIQDSVQLFLEDSTTWFGIHFLQVAPNGKMYGSTWNGGLYALHVINNPDLKGDSADFVYGGQPTYTLNSANLPNLINYKLGPLTGSGCDTITAITEVKTNNQEPRIIPNPANKYAYVEMGSQGNYRFELLTPTGQITDQKQTPQLDIFDTEHLTPGTYLIRVINQTTGAIIATKKLVVVH